MLKSVLRLSAAALLAASFSASVDAAEYTIDKGHTFIEFKVKHLGYSWLHGRFNDFKGAFLFDPSKGEAAQQLKIVIQTASIDSNHAERDKHLRNADFLDVEKFPTAEFESTGYKGDANGGVMTGNFTLMGITKPIDLAVTKLGEGKDPWGGYRAGFEGTASFKRSDYNMNYNLGPQGDVVHLELYLEGIRKK